MASIEITAGTLPPPACYANDQERLEAFVAAMVAVITGGIQWEASQTAPTDLDIYWLQLDSNNRPRHIRKYSVADAKWIPLLEIPYVADATGGTGDAITITNTPQFGTASAFLTGRKFVFVAPGTNTGAVTLTVDGLASKPVTKYNGAALVANDIISGQIVEVVYNLTANRFELQTPVQPYALTVDSVRGLYSTGTASFPASGASVVISHGGSEIPKYWSVRLRCTAAEEGYSVNDEADPINFFAIDTGGNQHQAIGVTADASSITISRNPGSGAGAGKVYVTNKTTPTSVPAEITTSGWEIVAYWL